MTAWPSQPVNLIIQVPNLAWCPPGKALGPSCHFLTGAFSGHLFKIQILLEFSARTHCSQVLPTFPCSSVCLLMCLLSLQRKLPRVGTVSHSHRSPQCSDGPWHTGKVQKCWSNKRIMHSFIRGNLHTVMASRCCDGDTGRLGGEL